MIMKTVLPVLIANAQTAIVMPAIQ